MSDYAGSYFDSGYECDPDAPDEGGFTPFEFQDGDEFVVLTENSRFKDGAASNIPYANNELRIVAGPLNDEDRDGGPNFGKDNKLFSKRLWMITSFSPKAAFMMKRYLRAIGHDGPLRLSGDNPEGQWQDTVCDREFVVTVKMEEYNGKMGAKVDEVRPIANHEWIAVSDQYEKFGPARGAAWSDDPLEPIREWAGPPVVLDDDIAF